jgi:hypothetical protein
VNIYLLFPTAQHAQAGKRDILGMNGISALDRARRIFGRFRKRDILSGSDQTKPDTGKYRIRMNEIRLSLMMKDAIEGL